MTRTDKIAEYLNCSQAIAAQVLRLVDDGRSYASIKDVADLTGRTKGTILSWIQRGQHDCPPALGTSSAGMVWDLDDWKRWAEAHPGLVYRAYDSGQNGLVYEGRTDLV